MILEKTVQMSTIIIIDFSSSPFFKLSKFMLLKWCLEFACSFVFKTISWKLSNREEEMRGRIRIFSLSLINNQNLVSLKNPPSIEFNTSISVSLRVRVPSFQFILINIQKNQRRLLFSYQFCFFFLEGREKKQSKSYYRHWRKKVLKIEIKHSLFWCGCVLVSRIQVIHCDDSKCTKWNKKSEPLKGN